MLKAKTPRYPILSYTPLKIRNLLQSQNKGTVVRFSRERLPHNAQRYPVIFKFLFERPGREARTNGRTRLALGFSDVWASLLQSGTWHSQSHRLSATHEVNYFSKVIGLYRAAWRRACRVPRPGKVVGRPTLTGRAVKLHTQPHPISPQLTQTSPRLTVT